MTSLNTVDLRERIALCDAFTPAERDFLLAAITNAAAHPYLVWSHEHGAWWGPNGYGYTKGLMTAGRYSRDGALDICRGAIPTAGHIGAIAEIPVRLVDVQAFLKDQRVPREITEHVYR